jgi:hypothetical protein
MRNQRHYRKVLTRCSRALHVALHELQTWSSNPDEQQHVHDATRQLTTALNRMTAALGEHQGNDPGEHDKSRVGLPIRGLPR